MNFVYLIVWVVGGASLHSYAQTAAEIRRQLDEEYVDNLRAGISHERAMSGAIEAYDGRTRHVIDFQRPENPEIAVAKRQFSQQFNNSFYGNRCSANALHDALSQGVGLDSYAQRERLYLATANAETDRARLLWVAQTWAEDEGKHWSDFDQNTSALRSKLKMSSPFDLYREVVQSNSPRDSWISSFAQHVESLDRSESIEFLEWLSSDAVKGGRYREVVAPYLEKTRARVEAKRQEKARARADAEARRPQLMAAAKERQLGQLREDFQEGLREGMAPQAAADYAREKRMGRRIEILDVQMSQQVESEFAEYVRAQKVPVGGDACSSKVAQAAVRGKFLQRLGRVLLGR